VNRDSLSRAPKRRVHFGARRHRDAKVRLSRSLIEEAIRQKNVGEKNRGRNPLFFSPTFFCLLFCTPKKIEAAILSDHSLFDHNREMMKQAYLIMKTFAAPGAITSQQAPSGRSLLSLYAFPPSPASASVASLQGGYFVARGANYGDSLTICPTHCCNPYNQLC
jgi:hypothetical protein